MDESASALHAAEYRRRLHVVEAAIARLDMLAGRISTVRIVLAIAGIAAIWWSVQGTTAPKYIWLVPPALFAAAVFYHSRVRRASARTDRAAAHYRVGLARIEDRWSGLGNPGTSLEDANHIYAADLDVFGPGNLFELLSTARTRMGERTLAAWLLSPAPTATVLQRQQSIAELRDRADLREDLAVLSEAGVGVRPEELSRWAESANRLTQRSILPAAVLLPVLLIAALIFWNVTAIASPVVVILLLELGVVRLLRLRLFEVLGSTEQAFDKLRLLVDLTSRLEREPLEAPLTKGLLDRLSSSGVPASRTIARLATIVSFVESRRNPLIQILDLPLLYSVHAALAAERWRRDHGRAVAPWLDVIGALEALISLSAYSYEHPDDPFPELVDGDASFVGVALGHPLLPQRTCVRNDVTISRPTRVLLISGSNMSGKSTLLRTVGLNTVLAMAGAPVRARHLRLSPLQVGANIRIHDSLQKGSSRFYAEITRLRQLNETARREPTLLFLLDEVLQGTNSRDRFIGAQGVIRALIDRGAIGLVTTHDLALTAIDVGGAERLRNLHFQDQLVDGRMQFDFKLHEGVVTKSNGIELMRSIGLEV
ncbi:MAG TPA: mismatch repair protein [Gammaproteobacteria bacterium]|nr:mismatch repair protein [Gammaproteobacteria bacterium]